MNSSNSLELRHPRPPTGGFGPFGPEVSRAVSDGVSPKIKVSERVSGGVSRGPSGPRAPECPKGVPRVSPKCPGHLFDTSGTLSGHLLDTPPDTRSDTSIFGDTPSDTARDTLGLKGPKPPVGGRGCLNPGNLSGVLNRDLRQYSCDTPYSAIGTRR